jgi:hypothetical protein
MTQEIFKTDGVFWQVEGIEVTLSVNDKENIAKAQEIIKENYDFISSVRVEFQGTNITYYDAIGDRVDDMPRVDVEQFIVFQHGVYYYAQNKYDSHDYIESEILI